MGIRSNSNRFPTPSLLLLAAALWLLGLLAPSLAAAQETAAQDTTPAAIFLVRHAEKKTEEDPRLTQAGHHRSAELTRVLGDAGLDAIYVTQWRRTRATAAPIATATGLEARIVETEADYATRIAETLLTQHSGEVVLVVGHSNTTPPVISALGIEQVPEISDDQYDDLFLVVFHNGKPRLISLDYGEPTS